jgi:hypothetical protein
VTPPTHSVLPATPPMVNPTSSPSVTPIGTSTDSSARTSAPPSTPPGTVSGTSTVPTPPSPAPPTPSAPTRECSAPVPPLVPARSPVHTRERHPAATLASTRSTAGRPPTRLGDYVHLSHLSTAPPAHFAPLYLSHFIAAPSIYAAAAAPDPDTFRHDQAMADTEHVSKWRAAAATEIRTLEWMGTWKEVPQT